jgi:hypothetical protein
MDNITISPSNMVYYYGQLAVNICYTNLDNTQSKFNSVITLF